MKAETTFRPLSPRQIGLRHGTSPILVKREPYLGHDMIHIREHYIAPSGEQRPGRKGISLHPHEAKALLEVLQEFFRVTPAADAAEPAARPMGAFTLQERALLILAKGGGAESVLGHLFDGDPGGAVRLKELGKDMRKAGLLEPGGWTLTETGKARAEALVSG